MSVSIPEFMMAPQHMGQHSKVMYIVHPAR